MTFLIIYLSIGVVLLPFIIYLYGVLTLTDCIMSPLLVIIWPVALINMIHLELEKSGEKVIWRRKE